jgi:hypothetical protein
MNTGQVTGHLQVHPHPCYALSNSTSAQILIPLATTSLDITTRAAGQEIAKCDSLSTMPISAELFSGTSNRACLDHVRQSNGVTILADSFKDGVPTGLPLQLLQYGVNSNLSSFLIEPRSNAISMPIEAASMTRNTCSPQTFTQRHITQSQNLSRLKRDKKHGLHQTVRIGV